ncbi:MAG: hypothetical protein IPJ04_12640 [Candidatus Eisenbacteria bacterium]|nr:hypothetical protein [Candidatus Eisenbacteria bacterium]
MAPGVIGIVATRLEQAPKPTLLLALDGDRGRGSGRSLPGVDLTRLLDGCSDMLLGHGGHAFAAGLEVPVGRLEEFRERFERARARRTTPPAAEFVSASRWTPTSPSMRRSTAGLARAARAARPGQQRATLPDARRRVENARTVGQRQARRRLELGERDAKLQAIGFHMGHHLRVDSGRTADLAFTPTRNEWNGETRVQLKLREIRLA